MTRVTPLRRVWYLHSRRRRMFSSSGFHLKNRTTMVSGCHCRILGCCSSKVRLVALWDFPNVPEVFVELPVLLVSGISHLQNCCKNSRNCLMSNSKVLDPSTLVCGILRRRGLRARACHILSQGRTAATQKRNR